ncbi:MAG: glycosyltransferase family 4 protein [Nitrosomonas sp.]|uniref:glycosyltransferase family 4 protein n=1 Tax=Nitrosomonas sp. TaxID=42353 RepID=UPI002734D121|nr:glycosyltransferase family 4 protein [Nitrosomonas sp.]MDP3662686.1 glycosyltransferase family 4 protein [Nitrosomonas sp.]MDZ4105139.1 glycosyltransferase family 4 protein [Nitrosomonas sp.]
MSRKILLLVSAMNSGGAERVAANLANAWVGRGDQVTLVATYSGHSECFYKLSGDVEFCYLADMVAHSDRQNPLRQIKRLLALRRLILAIQPDVVLSFLTNVNIAALMASCYSGYPTIVSERNYPPIQLEGWFYKCLCRWLYPYAASVVMQTSKGARWMAENLPGVRSTVIPNPAPYPLSVFEPRLTPSEYLAPQRKLLLAVGRLSEQKGFDYLLMAFSELAAIHQDWDLVILGEGAIRPVLESQIQALGLETRVHLPGQAGNVSNWYQRADLYVMSSRHEGFPNTLIEAMAHGCAVVSYDCDTGPRDIIRHGDDGLLVEPVGDVPALASALDQLMLDDEARQRMGQKAIGVRERYSVENVLRMWDRVFDEVAKKPNLTNSD